MTRLLKKIACLVVAISIIFSLSNLVSADQRSNVNRADVENFVERCYYTVLGRESDPEGKAYWVSKLISGQMTGTQVAHNFFFSPEYKALNRTDVDFVTDMYYTFLERDPDTAGLNFWVNLIVRGGQCDLDIFNGFAASNEFIGICNRYGINPGVVENGVESARSHVGPSIPRNNTANTSSEPVIQTITIQTSNGPVTVTGYYDVEAEQDLLNQLNAYRTANGLSTLTYSESLRNCARLRSTECVSSFSHTRPNGTSCFTAFPTGLRTAGENIAAGYLTTTDCMNAWQNSAGHNANMLAAKYTQVGIGVFVVTSGNSTYGVYYTQNFGTPM